MLTVPFILSTLGGLALASQTRNLGLRSLFPRQDPDLIDPSILPEGCEAPCIPMVAVLNECATSSDPSCGCDAAMSASVDACLACFNAVAPGFESSTQEIRDVYDQGCAGFLEEDDTVIITPSTDTEAVAITTIADDSTTTPNSSDPAPTSSSVSDSDEESAFDLDSNGGGGPNLKEASTLTASLFVISGAFTLSGLLF